MLSSFELLDVFFKLILALGLGSIIGFEREFHKHPGGLCTHVLVTMGSTIYTLVSIKIVPESDGSYRGDIGRIAAQIVTGIGFIGAGTIYKSNDIIKGLNTAASIWSSASIGMAVGSGLTELALMASLMILFVLTINNFYRKRIRRKRKKLCRENSSSNTIIPCSNEEYNNDSNEEYNNDDNN